MSTDRIRIKVIAKPKQKIVAKPKITHLDLVNLRGQFSSDSYYRTTISMVNKINKQYHWTEGTLPIQQYEQHFKKIMQFVVDTYTIKSREALAVKYSALIHPLKIVGYEGELLDKSTALKDILIIQAQKDDIPSLRWSHIIKVLDKNIKECGHPGGRIVALSYRYGYILSISEMVHTVVGGSVDGENYLDLDGLIWHIVGDINKNKPGRSFDINIEFAELVRPLIRKNSTWLISKKGGQPYKSVVALKHLQLSGFTLNQVRHTYNLLEEQN
jgi:hypothetical protein